MTYLAVAILLLVAAVFVLAVAWRRSRVVRPGDHPHCARCNHDLYGLPDGSARCPECGADLHRPSAVVNGRVERDVRRLVLAGAAALALACASAASWRSVDWPALRLRLAPASRLTADMARGGPAGSAAAEELERRLDAGRYDDDGDVRATVVRAFRPLRARGRAAALAGTELGVHVDLTPPISITVRAGDEPRRPRYVIYQRLVGNRIGDGPWVERGNTFDMARRVRAIDGDEYAFPLPPTLAPGPATLRLRYAFALVSLDALPEGDQGELSGYGNYDLPSYRGDFPIAYAWEAEVAVPFTVLPPGSTDVALVSGPATRPAMRASIRIASLPQNRSTDPATRGIRVRRLAGGDVYADWGVEFTGPPVAGAFEVFARDPASGREVRLGAVANAAGRQGMTLAGTSGADAARLADWPAPTADVVFRPSADVARRTPDLQQIWGEEVVIPGVPVTRVEPQTQPSD